MSVVPLSPLRISPDSLSPPPPLEASSSTTLPPSIFEQTTRNLLKLGSLAMDKFAQDPYEELVGFDIPPTDSAHPSYYLGDSNSGTRNDEEPSDEVPNVAPGEAVRYLREATLREFGATINDPLKYEFLEEFGDNGRSCILTITRPNGLSRSYRTKPEFSRKSDAKIAAATSAIQLGAVNFIKYGDAKSGGNRGLVLAKLDASGVKKDESDTKSESKVSRRDVPEPEEEQDDSAVAQIETCCIEWRAGSVIPKWVHLADARAPHAHGYALKICLSSNIQRAYSVLASEEYPKRSIAKAACARAALDQNVLEFIKHGDGLENPIVVPSVGAEAIPPSPAPTMLSLQAFHDALPKPLPDQIGVKANGELNAVGWLNTAVQMAKGSRMTTTFTWYTDAKLGLHGCLLRLSRPHNAPSQSYFVDAVFSKRSDAKLAVCLLASSQGVSAYIRSVAAEVEARVTPEMRRRSTEEILPALGQALTKFKHGSRPEFEYECDLSTFGCTLTIDVSQEGRTPIKRQWKVPLGYKSKGDAKLAVVCAAADDGVIEFIRSFEKTSEPELEEGETTEERDGKKRKKKKGKETEAAEGENEEELLKKVRGSRKMKREPVFETREEAIAKGRFTPKKQLTQRGFGGRGRGWGGRFSGNLKAHARGSGTSGPGFVPHLFSAGFVAAPAPGPSPVHPPFQPYAPPLPHHGSMPPLDPHGYAHPGPPLPPHSPAAAYGSYDDPRGRDYRSYLYHARSDPALVHAHAPPRVPPQYGSQGYGRDYEYDEYSVGPPQSPPGAYGYEYSHSPPPLSAYSSEYDYGGYRPPHTVPRRYEEPYAPDYDRIPDHVPPPHPHFSPMQSHSFSGPGPEVPRAPRAHLGARASYSRPPPPTYTVQEGVDLHDRKEESQPTRFGPSLVNNSQVTLEEKIDSVILSAETEGPAQGTEPRSHERRAAGKESSTHSSGVERTTTAVPSKRGRSADRDPQNDQGNKRARERSKSASRLSEPSRSADSTQEEAPDERRDSEGGIEREAKGEQKRSVGKKREGSKSYVATLFDHCDKEGIARPELCHEELTDSDGGKIFKIWIVMGKERLELQTTFGTLDAGQERVAKSVLWRLRAQTKKRQEA